MDNVEFLKFLEIEDIKTSFDTRNYFTGAILSLIKEEEFKNIPTPKENLVFKVIMGMADVEENERVKRDSYSDLLNKMCLQVLYKSALSDECNDLLCLREPIQEEIKEENRKRCINGKIKEVIYFKNRYISKLFNDVKIFHIEMDSGGETLWTNVGGERVFGYFIHKERGRLLHTDKDVKVGIEVVKVLKFDRSGGLRYGYKIIENSHAGFRDDGSGGLYGVCEKVLEILRSN